jgi:perosamine synthetase
MDHQVDAATLLAMNGGEPACRVDFGPRWIFDQADRMQLAQVMDRAERVWRSGDKLREFQRAFARAFGLRHVVPTGSGTAALHAAFGALDFEPGDEVITTPATDIGSLIGLMAQNLVPVFADWQPGTFNTDPADIERRITDRTRAILAVHLFGVPCEMDAILDIAHKHGLRVVEDCAQAHLAVYGGRRVGTMGDLAGFSFGQKTLSTDQGGMVASGDGDLATRARGFLSKGSERIGEAWLPYARLGNFAPMTDLQAAIGLSQLSKLEDATRRRETVAGILDETFGALTGFRTAACRSGDRNVYYAYPYYVDAAAAGVSLDEFVRALRAEGVIDAFGPYLKGRGLHRTPLFIQTRTYGRSGYPLRDEQGLARVDYACLQLPEIDRTLPGLGFFHMRNSFTVDQAEAIAAAVLKVARHFALVPPRMPMRRLLPDLPALAPTPATPATMPIPPVPDYRAAPPAAAFPLSGFDFSRFGAAPEGRKTDAARNDLAMNALLAAVGDHGARVFVPRGIYHFSQPIRLHGVRNLRFVGEGGNPVHPGTRWIYSGTDPAGLLDLATALYCGFAGLDLVALPGCGEQVVRLRCDDSRGDGLSTSTIDFEDCTIRVMGQALPGQLGVHLRDCANIMFRRCGFMGTPVGVELGQRPRAEAPTRSNGLANTVLFENCTMCNDITGRRASNVRLTECVFSVRPDASGAGVDFGRNIGDQVRNVLVVNCFAIESRKGTGTFFRQGPSGQGLVFQGNRIAGYGCGVDLDGRGYALVQANEFAQTAPESVDIRIGAQATEVHCVANDSGRTHAAGNPTVSRA